MRFILRAQETGDSSTPWFGHTFVTLTTEHIKELFARRELFQMCKSRDDKLHELRFWGNEALLVTDEADLLRMLTEDELAQYDEHDRLLVLDERENFDLLIADDAEAAPTVDVDLTVIGEEGVHYCFMLDGSDAIVASTMITWEMLRPATCAC